MAEYKCGDCIHADICEKAETLVSFSRDNPAYCGMFLNSADVAPVKHGKWERVIPSKNAAKWSNKVSCSNCHREGYTRYNYCPNCGSLNGGESDDNERSNF